MGTIRVQNVTVQFGGQIVLEEASLDLTSGEIVGIVGPNGAGKTTLFRLITGQLHPDIGTVTCSRGLEVGYLAQEPQIAMQNTLHDEVLSAFARVLKLEQRQQALSEQIAAAHQGPDLAELMDQYDRVTAEFTAAGGYAYEQRLNEILGGLGFTEADRSLPMSSLSGGQKCRAALAKLLLQDSTYLLLDEPTNHLDIDAVRWLEKFLAGHHGGAAIVSHDRYLLDRLAQRVVEVDRRKIKSYPGNYSNYVHVKHLRELTQERQYEQDKAFIEKERDYIARNIYAQRHQQAQGRLKRLERRLSDGEFVLEKPSARKNIKLNFDTTVDEGRIILDVVDTSKQFGDKVLFRNLSLQLTAGQRLGITGPNGTGKTTLLKIILGLLPADEGNIDLDSKSIVGYYAQEGSGLNSNTTVIGEILAARPDFDEKIARSFLARFLFRGDDVFKRIDKLSGGEQSRVRLAKLILEQPNVLILDEPTNHLDIPSREALEEALDDFPGTIITVSHDRYFLDRIVQKLLVLRPSTHSLHLGNYSDYIREIEETAKTKTAVVERENTKEKKRSPKLIQQQRKRSRYDRMTLDELELFIIEREERLADLQARFSDPQVYRDGAAVNRIREEFDTLKAELTEAEAVWVRRAEKS